MSKSMNVAKLNGKSVFVTATGVKVGSAGKVMPSVEFFATSKDKGVNRKVRKAERAAMEARKAKVATERLAKIAA